ncbi:hypothetical protein AAT19DRAFT_11100 [Rhodotorula toruloides]|uniref:Uncharacterized protein n=1 Tax=Rhodotorula toruloides TaxID=5286 RepID=A0A2S9ZX87_RHOTO|nr:hypothetical protein AAT19DRAFT_11100 [Rhodotorula toruloides]
MGARNQSIEQGTLRRPWPQLTIRSVARAVRPWNAIFLMHRRGPDSSRRAQGTRNVGGRKMLKRAAGALKLVGWPLCNPLGRSSRLVC